MTLVAYVVALCTYCNPEHWGRNNQTQTHLVLLPFITTSGRKSESEGASWQPD